MKIRRTKWNGRIGWKLSNNLLSLTVLEGGGHIASLVLNERPALNPFWKPVWKSVEPWQYGARNAKRYGGSKLLASISGHNLCLGVFGVPSAEEARAGLDTHGEAPVLRWRARRRRTTAAAASLAYGCDLANAGIRFARRISIRKNSALVRVRETLRNMTAVDIPFTMCEHVTLGPPFLEKGVTLFDMPATRCHTFPRNFSRRQRLTENASFTWPRGPGAGGVVDMRMIGRDYRVSSDFTTQLMDPDREESWFSAVNPRRGLLIAYVWKRSDFPWIGNWEENYCRLEKPWDGKSLTRGMEFANTPFPLSLREQVDMGSFHGQRTYRWLGARSAIVIDYDIVALPVGTDCAGVASITRRGNNLNIEQIRRRT